MDGFNKLSFPAYLLAYPNIAIENKIISPSRPLKAGMMPLFSIPFLRAFSVLGSKNSAISFYLYAYSTMHENCAKKCTIRNVMRSDLPLSLPTLHTAT